MENELHTLISDLLTLISPINLIETNTATSFLQNLLLNYDNLPVSTKDLVCRQFELFKCDSCHNNFISKEFTCSHNFCIDCFNSLPNPNSCLCLQGTLKIQSNAEKCKKCLKSINSLELNCSHYCEDCVRELCHEGIYSCSYCRYNFEMFFISANCTNCNFGPSEMVILCQQHKHCQNCAKRDLEMIKCSQCRKDLDANCIGKIVEFMYPMCEACRTRKSFFYVNKQRCCKARYCLLCLAENPNGTCFCGVQFDDQETIYGIKSWVEALFDDFKKVENSCKK